MPQELKRRQRLLTGLTAFIIAGATACNTRNPVAELGPLPIPTSTTGPTVPAPVSLLFALSFKPGALYSGESATGMLQLTAPAPAAGMTVSLLNTDPALSIPPSVNVPAGGDSVTFAVSAQNVPGDRDLTIVASSNGRSISAPLSLWTIVPVFFSFTSDVGDAVGRGASKRFTPANAVFTAWCNASQVTVTIDSANEFWRTTFAAPRGTPITTGTYESTAPASTAPQFPNTNGPEMSISGNGAGCTSTGRFVVRESQLTAKGGVTRFWASFEQRCQGRSEVLRGDVRVLDPKGITSVVSCR